MELRIFDRLDKNTKGRLIKNFNRFSLDLKYDSVASQFSFEWYFNPNDSKAIELAHVSHFHIVNVVHAGQQLLRGYILSESFTDKATETTNVLAGYSLPGVLEDCEIPISRYPLQFDGLSLKSIAEALLTDFDFTMIVDPSVAEDMDIVFETTKAGESETIKKYLTDLAAQRNINITHDANGNLIFNRIKTDMRPIAHFHRGIPGLEMELVFNGQGIHSQITVMKQASSDGGNAGEVTLKNPYAPYVFRPKVIKQDSGTDIDTTQACKNAIAEELKNIKVVISTDRWLDPKGNMYQPNTMIAITNNQIFLYEKTNMFIERVTYQGDEKSMTAKLYCVLPECYNNQTPINIFTKWE